MVKKEDLDQITDAFFEITMELPNEMLNGCDGTNVYESRIRACPIKSTEVVNSIQIHKFGEYPNFQIFNKSKTVIKLTIIQVQKWP